LAERIIHDLKPPVKGPHPVAQMILVPSGGGIFEVEVDGEMVFSKHQAGRHAEPNEILATIRQRLS
jgi:selenoprotein W-related protein